jgi:uncharacterized membrane protein
MKTENKDAVERKILSPSTWLFYSSALFAIILVPVFTGAFYMLRVSQRLFEQKLEYSVIAGIILGIIVSLAAGYFYSNMARKHAE